MYWKYLATWSVFPKFSEVICLPFLTPGVPHMACHMKFRVFWRQAIVACPIESTDFVIFLALNDFLNVAQSHPNTFFLSFGNVFLSHWHRIRIEFCRLNGSFKEQRFSISNKPLVKSWAKRFPSILKRI